MEDIYREKIIRRFLPIISKTFITPNMITMFNIIFSVFIFFAAYNQKYILGAILFQVYELLDHLDGSLARYKSMSSKLGAKLDSISDFIFYNFIYIFIGINNVNYKFIVWVIVLINIYAIISTYYIVPHLRKLRVVKRRGIKKWFMDRGYIIGMDLTLLGIITSICLILGKIKWLYILIIFGYLVDIFYRIIELKYNESLKENKKK